MSQSFEEETISNTGLDKESTFGNYSPEPRPRLEEDEHHPDNSINDAAVES